jgi:hypothetical protein
METIHRDGSDARHPFVNHHEPARIGIRPRAQNDGVDDAEDRRRRPDPEGQCQRGGKSKSGISLQLAQRIARVLTEIAEPADGIYVAGVLFGKCQIAEAAVSFESGFSPRTRFHEGGAITPAGGGSGDVLGTPRCDELTVVTSAAC